MKNRPLTLVGLMLLGTSALGVQAKASPTMPPMGGVSSTEQVSNQCTGTITDANGEPIIGASVQ